jgi:hypothetical protein
MTAVSRFCIVEATPEIPSPDAAGYWHFTYRITDPVDGRWYGGKRSTKKQPLVDPYKGSGNWVRAHPNRQRLQRKIVAFYATSADVFAAEAELITWTMVFDDPLCMNLRDGGEGVSVEAALLRLADPDNRAKHLVDMRRMHANPIHAASIVAAGAKRGADPGWQAANAAHMVRMHADPVARKNADAALERLWADPEHVAKIASANRRMIATPEWREAHAAGMQRAQADPVWQAAMAAKNRRLPDDPKWRAAQANGSKKRSESPEWQAWNTAKNRRNPENPVWREKNVVNLERAHAALAAKHAAGTFVRCDTIFVDLNGKRMPLSDACHEAGISYQTVYARQQRGLPESRWFEKPRKGS